MKALIPGTNINITERETIPIIITQMAENNIHDNQDSLPCIFGTKIFLITVLKYRQPHITIIFREKLPI